MMLPTLRSAFLALVAGATAVAAAPAPLAAPAPAHLARRADSIVLTLGGENGGQGVNALQCNNGVATATINLQASINVNNLHAYQPMGELGLPTVTATFTLNGAPAQLTLNNAFNVQAGSTASGNTWVFTLQDDGPHPGGQFNLGACTAGTTPTVTIAFSSSAITDAQGLPNGADGGPAVPQVNGPVTVVNGLPTQFNGGTGAAATTTSKTSSAAAGNAATSTTATAATTSAAAAAADGACTVTIPANALSATGLSTPWVVSGGGCLQTADGMQTFAECTIVDTTNGNLFVYSPLVINKGQAHVTPVVPTLPANSVVGCWFGTNGASTTLADNNKGADLKTAACVNGDPNTAGDIFGQFAACNGAAFFTAAKAANPTIPALGTGSNGKPCYTTRSFSIVDMDQSDNVISTYLLDGNGKIGQKTTANAKTLTTEINNGSDNVLLASFMRPALGCTDITTTDLADPNGAKVPSLALQELQANALQAAPIALVPPNDPMVVDGNGNIKTTKLNAYRAAVGQPTAAGSTTEATTYCQNYLDVGAPSIITDAKFTKGFSTPDAGNGADLFTFLGQRYEASWTGLGCQNLVKVTYLNATAGTPIIANRDANGVTQSLTFNTASLLALAQTNGLATGSANAGTGTGGAVTSTIVVTVTRTHTVTGGAAATTAAAATTTSKAAAAATTTAAAGGGNAATGATVTHTLSSGFTNGGWCSGSGQFQTQLTLSVKAVTPSVTNSACSGRGPMGECGLPTFTVAVTKNGAAVNIVSWNGNAATGNTFSFTETDDAPYYGGGLVLDIPCSYGTAGSTPADAASGVAFAFSTTTPTVDLTLNDGTTVTANVVIAAGSA
ncbi:hypothetical protein HK405_001161 [Cladochytrium tenue]|nr:hypothetical protein HK405_001161 [Cladochytrium tenue]